MHSSYIYLILLSAFAIFLVHAIIPHSHYEEHSNEYGHESNSHRNEHNSKDDLFIKHQIDEVFILNKPLNILSKPQAVLFISVSAFFNNPKLNILSKEFPEYKQESIPTLPILNFHSLRAPPVV